METKDQNKQKKVLIFVPEFPGLTETFIEREISKLIDLGNLDITVFSLKKGAGSTNDAVRDKTVYHRLNLWDIFVAIIVNVFRLPRVCKAYRVVKHNPNRNFFSSLSLFAKSLGYAWYFYRFHPDMIYANFMSESSTLCLVASIVLGCDFAISAHAKDILVTTSPNKCENAELVKQKVGKAKFVAICNRHAYNKVLELSGRGPDSNVKLIYHGLDFDALNAMVFEPLPKPKVPLIFTNGRFTEKKGHKFLVEASKILLDRGFGHMIYILGGPGEAYQATVDYIRQLGLEDTVKIIGEGQGVPFSQVVAYYRISDVFVFPSIDVGNGDADGIANTLIEASAFGLPLVTTDAGSTLEFVEHDKTGLVVPQRDSYELANALERVIVDPELAGRLGSAAYSKAVDMFDIGKNVREIEELLVA